MKIFVLVSTLLSFPVPLLAHDTLQYTVRQFTDENGLPQNSVKGLAKDKSGFLWMATENGVVRFDGQHFRTFNKANLDLLSSRMAWLLPDLQSDGLFSVTDRDQVIYMHNGTAELVDIGNNDRHRELKYDETGQINCNSLGLPNQYATILNLRKYKINKSASHFFLMNTDSIHEWNNGQLQASIAFRSATYWQYFLFNGRLYHLQGSALTMKENKEMVQVGKVQGDICLHPGIANGKLHPKIFWNVCTGQVLMTAGNSLYLVKEAGAGKLTTQLLLEDFDFEQNRILTMYYDTKYQRIFMGSHTRGLFVFTRKPFYSLRSGRGDVDDVYYSQAAFNDSLILTPQGDIMGLKNAPALLPLIGNKQKDDRSSILIDHKKNIWTKYRQELFMFSPSGKELLKEWRFPSILTMLYEDCHQNLYIGTKSKTYVLDLKDPVAEPQLVFPEVLNISYFQEDGSDSLWIGTGEGLFRLSRKTGQAAVIPELTEKYVRSIYVRQAGEIWITTNEEGFYLYRKGTLTRLPQDKGNYLASAHCVLEDEKGYFWITTNKGLFQARRQDLLDFADGLLPNPFYLYYDKHLGFNTNEFNGGCQPCAIRLGNGMMSLPSLNGLVLGKPSDIVPEVPEFDLFVDRIEIDGNQIETSDTISLTKHFDFFRLFVSTPYFGNPTNRQLDFSLVKDGHAASWMPVDADGSIKLSSLASGTYHIMVRKANGFGKDNYHLRRISLVVPPAFYETWWFRALIALVVVYCFILYMRIKLRIVHRQNRNLEARIDERTRALQDTLTELQQSEESLRRQTRMQDRLITAITHDIKTPLRYLTDAARRLYENTGDTEEQRETKRNAQLIHESGYRMYHLTDNLLQYIRLNSSNIRISFNFLDLYELVESKLKMFNEIAAEQGTTIVNSIDPGLQINSNHHLLGIIIHNLLDNAVKATYEGSIEISATGNSEVVILRVEDTGFGMPAETRLWCNGELASKETDGLNGISGKTGLGLIIVKDLVTLMLGHISVNEGENGGTVVELIFRKP